MRAAESLYLDGLISYPRTDNTVYPPSLELHASLEQLAHYAPVAATAARLARAGKLTPTKGKRRTTDHPPIYPVGAPSRELSGDQAKVYDLVARRFLATSCRPPWSRASVSTSASAASRSWRAAAVSPSPGSSRSTRSTPRSGTGRCRRCSRATSSL